VGEQPSSARPGAACLAAPGRAAGGRLRAADLLSVAIVGVLVRQPDPAQHAKILRASGADSPAYRTLRGRLADIQRALLLTTPIHTLVEYDRAGRRADQAILAQLLEGAAAPSSPAPVSNSSEAPR
jgi:hypothetical protein